MICPDTISTGAYIGFACAILAAGVAIALILAAIAWGEYLDDVGTARRLEAITGKKP